MSRRTTRPALSPELETESAKNVAQARHLLETASESALGTDLPLHFLLRFSSAIINLAREEHHRQRDLGQSPYFPPALIERIEAVRNLVVRLSLDPSKPSAVTAKLHRLAVGLTKTVHLVRPAPSAEVAPTHPASISQSIH